MILYCEYLREKKKEKQQQQPHIIHSNIQHNIKTSFQILADYIFFTWSRFFPSAFAKRSFNGKKNCVRRTSHGNKFSCRKHLHLGRMMRCDVIFAEDSREETLPTKANEYVKMVLI